MKTWILAMACAVLVGCDYRVPIQNEPSLNIDSRIVGLWERVDAEGQAEHLLVLPLGAREYFVSFPQDSQDAIFARAWLCKIADRTFVQLKWFGTARGKTIDSEVVYQVASYEVSDQDMKVALLNPEVVLKDAQSTEELVRDIENNLSRSDLFRKAMEFTRIPPE